MLHETNLHPASMEVTGQGAPQMYAEGGYEASGASLQFEQALPVHCSIHRQLVQHLGGR